MVNVHVDMASALLLAEAAGVPRLAAAELIMDVQDGVAAAKAREGKA